MNKIAKKYISYYINASRAKEKTAQSFKKFNRYWEGDTNKPKSENDPASNTNICHANVEGQVCQLTDQTISVAALPVTPYDRPFAKTTEKILEFIKTKNHLLRTLDIHERRREKYGTGILRVTYDPAALGGMGMPVIEAVDLSAVYVDPSITDVYRMGDAEFIIERIKKSVWWAKEKFGAEVAAKIKPNFDPAFDSPDSDFDTGGDSDWYIHLLVWTKKGGKLRLVEMTGCGIILSDSGEGFYKTNRYPYFFTPLYYREGSIWGKGDIELLIPVQDLINDLDDQIRINARLSGNPQRLVETGSGIDLDCLTNEAGLNIPVTNVTSVKNLEAPALPSYIENRRNTALQYESQRVTRFSDQMAGNNSNVKTATEAIALQQSGNAALNHKKAMLSETLSEVFSFALELCKEFWTSEMAFRVTDSDGEFVYFTPSDLSNIDRGEATGNAEFDILVTVGSGMPRNKAFVYQVMTELMQNGVITAAEARKYLQSELGLPISPEGETQAAENK